MNDTITYRDSRVSNKGSTHSLHKRQSGFQCAFRATERETRSEISISEMKMQTKTWGPTFNYTWNWWFDIQGECEAVLWSLETCPSPREWLCLHRRVCKYRTFVTIETAFTARDLVDIQDGAHWFDGEEVLFWNGMMFTSKREVCITHEWNRFVTHKHPNGSTTRNERRESTESIKRRSKTWSDFDHDYNYQ